MNRLSLSQRLTLVFALLLVACCAVSGWLQVRSNTQYSQQVIQRLSVNLAQHITENNTLLGPQGLNPTSVKKLFDQLMSVNPSVEVYLLDKQGHIIGDAAPEGRIKRRDVSLEPINALMQGQSMPVLGDDPRSIDGQKVFSVAPLQVDGKTEGYLYVVLLGEDYARLADDARMGSAALTAFWSMGLIMLFGSLAGWLAFRWVTKPVRQLTRQVIKLEQEGLDYARVMALSVPEADVKSNEVTQLRRAFVLMAKRIAEQWKTLAEQDQQRREFIANISHDLRTPLTSLHGYLETLSIKSSSLSDAERKRYLDIALAQSLKVGRLAQELFELARLEYGVVKPQKERMSFSELLQDVFQKFELTAETRQIRLSADVPKGLPLVNADIYMMERVLTNLLDNAIRHTPSGGYIAVKLWHQDGQMWVQLTDSGTGIPEELKAGLFERPSLLSGVRRQSAGGLGLMIVKRMLQLHDGDIMLVNENEQGACFRLMLPV
ncbi:ATP-binding protein [Hafnia paralvei]|uniref:histidine kinase n=2 Tax=Hafnia paralvei TaxID=546367 RepID=A0A4Q9EBM3_9GAMM|nr:ATP-binding protein [Hafnia paralvei]TBM20736.1 HAMP domain-containing histidine kinase [Hafnia paralvei]